MKTTTKMLSFCALGIVTIARVASAADFRYLASLADAVVVGTIETRTESDTRLTFDLSVQRALKGGDLLAGPVVKVDHAWVRAGIVAPASSASFDGEFSGIWFLTRLGSDWDVMPVSGPPGSFMNLFLPARVTGVRQYTYEASAATVDKVVYEMADGLIANGSDPWLQMRLLAYDSTPATDKVLSDLILSTSSSLRRGALEGLLMNSKPAALQALPQIWPTLAGDQQARWLIADALRDGFRDTSPASAARLITLAQDPATDPELKKAALRSLRSVHTKETVPFFASLLTSLNTTEQMDAVVAISSFANGCPAKTRFNVASMEYMRFTNPSVFRNKETMSNFVVGTNADYQKLPGAVAFWSAWWAKNRGAVVSAN